MHFTDILNLAAAAWHEVKDANDPEFNECQVTHREKLGAAAKAVVDSGQAFDKFDRIVLRLHKERLEAMAKVEQILEQNPRLHGDEVMHIASGVPHPLSGPQQAANIVTDALFGGHAEDATRAATREEFHVFGDNK